MRRKSISAVFVLTVLAAPLAAQKFYPDDPLRKEPPPLNLNELRFRKVNDLYDLFRHTLGHPGQEQPEPGQGPPVRALSANTLDEAPDSAWITNRIGARPVSIEELTAIPADQPPPADGTWTIVGAKTEGITPGFRIRDSRGAVYFVKFDPLSNPEMTTAADVIGAFFFRALGYNVPTNHLVYFHPDQLEIAAEATVPDETGRERPLSTEDVRAALVRVPRLPDGRIRAVASNLIPGKIIGEFRYSGTRSDDPNDIVPHEHRRELRGLHVFSAWLNHNDSRAINTLDSIVEEDGRRFVRHYLIDFGAIIGSASVQPKTARDGNAYFYQFKPALAQIATLGLYVPAWARADYIRSDSIGLINWEAFDAEEWRPNYPNPAFQNRLPDDNFWAAKKVMAFTAEQIRAIVRTGQYSSKADEELVVRYLCERRFRIGRRYFRQVLPLDEFRIEDGQLKFEDLAAKYDIDPSREYTAQWSRFDNRAQTHEPLDGVPAGFTLPAAIAEAPAGSYFAAAITAPGEKSAGKNVVVFLRKENTGVQVVGIERNW
ncbi:MAG: hypothetical protein ACRD5F_01505 [Candidatus Acidiferrales bacterium]